MHGDCAIVPDQGEDVSMTCGIQKKHLHGFRVHCPCLLLMQFPLSIIIPTHKRRDILRQCLECIAKQTILRSASSSPSTRRSAPRSGSAQHDTSVPFEVIVVSDGPDEKTSEMIQSLSWPFEIQHFAIPKSQQGVARNRAAEKARGKISLLIGDDIFLASNACEKHLRAHEARSTKFEIRNKNEAQNFKLEADSDFGFRISDFAVLGFTTWDPTLNITPTMRWMEESGVQFGYPQIAEFAHAFLPEDRQHFFTYTINLSIPTKLL